MTDSPQTDVERARAAYEAYNARDLDRMLELFHPEIEWHDAPELPQSGVHRGHDGIVELLREFDSVFGAFEFDVESVEQVAEGRVLAIARAVARGSASGTPVEMRVAHLIDLDDGRARVVRGFLDVDEARRAASGEGLS